MPVVLERLLRIGDVAELLQVRPRTIYEMVARGVLLPLRPTGGRALRFRAQDVERLLDPASAHGDDAA